MTRMTVSGLCSGDQLEVQAPTVTETSNRQSLFEITQILTVMSDLTYFHFLAWFCQKKKDKTGALSIFELTDYEEQAVFITK